MKKITSYESNIEMNKGLYQGFPMFEKDFKASAGVYLDLDARLDIKVSHIRPVLIVEAWKRSNEYPHKQAVKMTLNLSCEEVEIFIDSLKECYAVSGMGEPYSVVSVCCEFLGIEF